MKKVLTVLGSIWFAKIATRALPYTSMNCSQLPSTEFGNFLQTFSTIVFTSS